jgi:hypothetical protein
VVLEAAFFSRLFVFDKYLRIKLNLNKNVNNASLTPTKDGPCCDQAPSVYLKTGSHNYAAMLQIY